MSFPKGTDASAVFINIDGVENKKVTVTTRPLTKSASKRATPSTTKTEEQKTQESRTQAKAAVLKLTDEIKNKKIAFYVVERDGEDELKAYENGKDPEVFVLYSS